LKTASEDLTQVDRANNGVVVFLANKQTFKVITLASAEIVCKLPMGQDWGCQAAIEAKACPVEMYELINIFRCG